jgi:8-oxo-dGTP pyrophosphatase MutT (NUDIX family)
VNAPIPIRPAATVIVLRDMPSGLEVLLVQRAGELAFHGGAWVFPGGRVEPEDLAQADALSAARAAELSAARAAELSAARAAELSAARAAGVRETREEAGLTLAGDALLPFSHWTTPEGRPRRFSTWFFLAEIAPHFDVVVDGGEIHAHRWLTPEAALVLRAQGEIDLPPPTFVSLSVLTACACVADALSLARAQEPPVFVPRPRDLVDGVVSLFPGDAAYEGGELSLPGARHRLWMLSNGYRYERA